MTEMVKNRRHNKEPNGKFFCSHDWELAEDVGSDWDTAPGICLLCRCIKCGKRRHRNSYLIREVSSYRIKNNILYR
jgi:hypothetical protein